MTWELEEVVRHLADKPITVAYNVRHEIENFPVDLTFTNKELAKEVADWLNKKDNWIDRLETIIEHETSINLEKLRL